LFINYFRDNLTKRYSYKYLFWKQSQHLYKKSLNRLFRCYYRMDRL